MTPMADPPHLTLYLIRHGQCLHNVKAVIAAQNDSALTPLGREQARANGKRLPQIAGNLSALDFFASPLHRACVTMELLREAAGLEPSAYFADRRLMEIDFGDHTWKTWKELAFFGDARHDESLWEKRRPRGESLAHLEARLADFLAGLRRDSVIVSHAGAIRLLRMRLLGLSHRDGLEYHPESYGILRLSQGSETFFAA